MMKRLKRKEKSKRKKNKFTKEKYDNKMKEIEEEYVKRIMNMQLSYKEKELGLIASLKGLLEGKRKI